MVRTLERLRAAALLTMAAGSCVAALSYPAGAGARALRHEAVPEQRGGAAPERAGAASPRAAYAEYRVAAGTALPIELRTHLSSATSRVHDVVEGRLLRALTGDDLELVPAGALILGSVTEVEAATRRNPARLSFTFVVVEHPDTGSRATIRTSVLAYRSDTPQRRQPLPALHIPKDSPVTVTLLAPLLVRIPAVPRPVETARPTRYRSISPTNTLIRRITLPYTFGVAMLARLLMTIAGITMCPMSGWAGGGVSRA